jgi:hypothetical protein
MADSETTIILGQSGLGTRPKLASIGREWVDGKLARNVVIDFAHPHRIAVFGKVGTGKSHTLGVLTEEIALQKAGRVIVLDPLGTFWGLTRPSPERKLCEQWGLTPHAFSATIFSLKGALPGGFKQGAITQFAFHGADLSVDEYLRLLDIDPQTQMANVVQVGLVEMNKRIGRQQHSKEYSLDELQTIMIRGFKGNIHPTSQKSLQARFLRTKSWDIFDADLPSVDNVVSADGLSVAEVGWLRFLPKHLPHDLLIGVVSDALLRAKHRLLFDELKDRTATMQSGSRSHVADRSWLILDEAKFFIPPDKTSRTRKIVAEYVEQGRNLFASVIIATQSPELIDAAVLSQTDVVIAHRLSTHENMKALSKRVRSQTAGQINDLLNDLPAEPGFAAGFDDTRNEPVVFKIRPRISLHIGGDI